LRKKERFNTLLLLILLLGFLSGKTQDINIQCKDKPLQQILLELRDQYKVQFSYNPEDLEDCKITKNQNYPSPETALTNILSACQLSFIKKGNIFIIKREHDIHPPPKKQEEQYAYSGKIIDKSTLEALPFASIQFEHQYFITDASGNFSFLLSDSIMNAQVSYVGYYQTDSILNNSSSISIGLSPSTIGLKEIEIHSKLTVFNMHLGRQAGAIKINPVSASFLPGSQNNSIYNLLRLQAGIMAAGEQNNDYTIWGSYPGQTLIQFDHMTLFNISSFDNNLSVINPLIVKDIEVKKGGFNAEFSNRVGGIVNITGKDGNNNKLHGQINLNNQALSLLLNVPIAKKVALQAAFRKSLYQLLDWNEILKNNDGDVYYQPSYNYKDLNIKLSGQMKNKDNYYLSLLASDDQYTFEEKKSNKVTNIYNSKQNKQQIGASFFYNKHWNKGGFTNSILSYSELNSDIKNIIQFQNPYSAQDQKTSKTYTSNSINEFTIKLIHYLPTKSIHQVNIGIDYQYHSVGYLQDTSEVNLKNKDEKSNNIGAFIKDNISISEKLSLQPGMRLDYFNPKNKIFLQPRLNAIYRINKKWNINMALGVYNQFLSKNTTIDKQNNYSFAWALSNAKSIPVVSSQHMVLGGVFDNDFFKFSIEAFYKKTKNISLFINNMENNRSISKGKAHSIGMDIYLKYLWKKHEFWVTYTLGQTLENFSYFNSDSFQLAPHNQTHEVKTAAVFHFQPFFFSANYVYGSGLEFTRDSKKDNKLSPYHRLDMAAMYKFKTTKLNLEIGLSVLNVLNHYNIGYNYYSNSTDSKSVYSKTISFTPLLNLNIGF